MPLPSCLQTRPELVKDCRADHVRAKAVSMDQLLAHLLRSILKLQTLAVPPCLRIL